MHIATTKLVAEVHWLSMIGLPPTDVPLPLALSSSAHGQKFCASGCGVEEVEALFRSWWRLRTTVARSRCLALAAPLSDLALHLH